MKLKVETTVRWIYQQLLDFITIDVIKIEQKNLSSKYIITLPMTDIINSSFKKHPMSWEFIHRRMLHPSDSIMKEIFRHRTLYILTKQCPKKMYKAPC